MPFAFHNITVVTADNCISMKTDETSCSELSRLVWEPILFKQYQTMSGYCTDTKNFQSPLNLYEFVPPSKKLIPPVHSWDIVILEPTDQIGHIHFWPCQPKKFRSTINFWEFVSTSKKVSSNCSGEIVDMKIP